MELSFLLTDYERDLGEESLSAPNVSAITAFESDARMNAALYARVSTKDKGQDVTNQLRQLRDFCAKQGWEVVHQREHREHGYAEDGNHRADRCGIGGEHDSRGTYKRWQGQMPAALPRFV